MDKKLEIGPREQISETYNLKIGIAMEFLVVLIGMQTVYIAASFTGENHLENFFLHRIGEL